MPPAMLDELRGPVPGDEDRVEPLERGDRHALGPAHREAHGVDPRPLAGDEVQGGVARVR